VRKIGFLAFASCRAQHPNDIVRQFRDALATFGYTYGKDFTIECRIAATDADQAFAQAEELVRLKMDVIVAHGTPSALAAQRATQTIPIVIFNIADPIRRGLVASLARPGGNITGLSNLAEGQTLKGFELLQQAAPQLARVAVLTDLSNLAQAALVSEQDAAAQARGLKIQRLDVRAPSDIDTALAAALRDRAQALYLYPLRISDADAKRIVDFSIKHRLPALAAVDLLYLSAGVLFHYSHSLAEQYQRLAWYVDSVLRGTKPAELPVEQPTKFELVINLKTAKAMGLTIPHSLLLRADRVLN
jgi:putative ABC transport system substrate-binding protein